MIKYYTNMRHGNMFLSQQSCLLYMLKKYGRFKSASRDHGKSDRQSRFFSTPYGVSYHITSKFIHKKSCFLKTTPTQTSSNFWQKFSLVIKKSRSWSHVIKGANVFKHASIKVVARYRLKLCQKVVKTYQNKLVSSIQKIENFATTIFF